MNEGYRVSWQTTLGGSPPGIVYKNDRKWSADHGGYDYAITSGVFVTSRAINTQDPRIIDIAPTVLRYFGLSVPTDIDGKPLSIQPGGSMLRLALVWRRRRQPDRAPASADATARQATEAQAKRAADRLAALQHEAESLATAGTHAARRAPQAGSRARDPHRSSLTRVQRDIAGVQRQLAAATARAQALQGEADRQRPDVEARLVAALQDGPRRLLASPPRRRQPARHRTRVPHRRRARTHRSRSRRRTSTDAGSPGDRTGDARRRARKSSTALQRKAQAASAAVERAVAARTELVQSIDSRRDLNAQLTGELQEAQRKLQATIARSAAGRPRRGYRAPAPSVPGGAALAGGGCPVGPVRAAAASRGRSRRP